MPSGERMSGYEIQRITIYNPDKQSLVVTAHVTDKLSGPTTQVIYLKPFVPSNSIQDILDQIHAPDARAVKHYPEPEDEPC